MQPRKIFIIFILLHLAINSHGKTSLHTFKRDNSKTETYLQCSSVLSVSSQEECVTTALQSGHRTAIFNEKYSTCSICDERGRQHIVQEGGVKWDLECSPQDDWNPPNNWVIHTKPSLYISFENANCFILHSNGKQFLERTAALSNGFRIFHSIEHKDHDTLGMEVVVNESRSNHSFYAVEDPGISVNTWYHYGATFLMDTQLKLNTDGILVKTDDGRDTRVTKGLAVKGRLEFARMSTTSKSQVFKGKLDDLLVFSQMLTEEQMIQLTSA